MNNKAVVEPKPLDTVKLALALALLLGGVVAYHYYAEVSKLIRVGGILATVAAAFGIAYQTDQGRQIAGFVRDAQIEVRKVVWPTRQETAQTTFVVMIVVVVFAFLLWILDIILGGLMQTVIGHGA